MTFGYDIEFSGVGPHIMPVVEGEFYNLTCNIGSGFPALTTLSLQCAGLPVEEGRFIFSGGMTSAQCVCQANHCSGSYSTSIQIDIVVLRKKYVSRTPICRLRI